MAISQLVRSFNGGELSPYCDALTTSDKYASGCRVLENFIPTVYGPLNRRPGLEHIGSVKDDTQRVRLVPFVFSDTERYVLEFGNLCVRVRDASTLILNSNDQLPGWVHFRAYAVGDMVAEGGLNPVNIYQCLIAHTSDAGTSLPVYAAEGYWKLIESPGLPTPYTVDDLREIQFVQINDIAYFTHPLYAPQKMTRQFDGDGQIQFTFAEVAWLWPALLEENADDAFTIQPSNTVGDITLTATKPIFDARQIGGYFQLGYERPSSSVQVNFTASGSSGVVRAIGEWTLNTYGTWAATLTVDRSYDNGLSWSVIRSFVSNSDRNVTTTGEEPRQCLLRLTVANRTVGTTVDQALLELTVSRDYGLVRITGVTDAGHASATVLSDIPATLGIVSHIYLPFSPTIYYLPGSATPTVTITAAPGDAGTGATAVAIISTTILGFPFLAGFHVTDGGRNYATAPVVTFILPDGTTSGGISEALAQIIPSAHPETAFWSEGAWSNYRGFPRAITTHENRVFYGGTAYQPQSLWGTNIDDYENFRTSTLADAGLFFTVVTRRTNPIQWLYSKDGSLQVGTLGGEGTLGSSDPSTALSPNDIQWSDLTSYGSRHLPAVLLNDSLFFVQKAGRKVRELAFDFSRRAYGATDVTVLAEHVTRPSLVEYDAQQHPDAILWCVRDDGQLVGMTYERDQQVQAWHRHTTAGTFESVCVIPGDTGDEVWVATCRTINGATRRFIERFKPDWRETFDAADQADWFYLDCAKRIVNGSPSSVVTGLDHLDGQSVQILADGAVMSARTVTGGSITLDAPATTVIVGLPYTSTLRPMKLYLDLQDGPSRGRKARIANVTAQVLESLGCQVSTDGTQWDTLLFRSTDDAMDASPPPYSGESQLVAAGNYSDGGGDLWIRQQDPMPLTLIALVPVWAPTSN